MAECYIRAVKVQGEVVALALCRIAETRPRSYSTSWSDRISLVCLYRTTQTPSDIRYLARRNWGICYYESECDWGEPIIVPPDQWCINGQTGRIPLKEDSRYWPNP